MDKLRFTRFTKIYSSRKRAIEKLDATARYYAETVAIMYRNGESFDILLALYRSEATGDYTISYDSAIKTENTGKTYSIERINGGDDKETIRKSLISASERDILIITGEYLSFYLYHNNDWFPLGNTIQTEDTNSVILNIENGVLTANVNIIDCGYL